MAKKESPNVSPDTMKKKAGDMVVSTIGIHKDIYKKCLTLQTKSGLPYVQDIFRIAIAEYVKRNEL